MSLDSGARLGHYLIVDKLGAGGMGEVWRATDTTLGREVALKVLPEAMTADPDRIERFQREARALAALDHPGIVTVFSVEESEGVHFLTMQLVEGQPLDRLIPAEGLPLELIVTIATALAEALAAAHERGIVHRDLKPSNVMVTSDGRVKVLDFGLAKVSGPGTEPEATVSHVLTQAGAVMGTMPYMSPEQVSGRPVDHRTDVFALGVILYEMATGRRPFQGACSAELVSAIMRDTPAGVVDLRADVPAELARVIGRCLEKDARRRIQTARDVGNELADLAPAAAPPRSAALDSGAARLEEGFWIAVLPFKYTGGNADLTALAEGLTEEIVTGLSRFSYLRVIAHSSIARHASEAADLRAAGKALGARYLMEGSLRQAGAKLRLAVQLVDATSGAHLWAENYERAFSPDAVFELQDELVPQIVSTVADQNGILTRRMSETLRSKSEDALTPHEAVLRAFSYFERVTPDEHLVVRRILERAVREAPDHADCWAMLSLMYSIEFADDFNPGPDPLDRALAAAQRAVHLAATHALGHYALAFVYFLRKEIASFRATAEKALALNPMDGSVMGILGLLIDHAGEVERGCQIVEAAMQLNPNYPGLFRWPAFRRAYRQGRYAEALELAVRIDMPDYFYAHAARAAALGQLGQREAAEKELRELLALRPDFAAAARREFSKWYDAELVEHMIEGLRKAGLEVPPEERSAAPALDPARSSARGASGAVRAEEGFWVAVLPFKSSGSSADLTALAEGLSEEIVTGLSRFSYLRVIARGSTAKYTSQAADLRTVGKELGARYVMEGSLRQAGSKLRLAVQLVDAESGAHLWAENYERVFSPEAVFELQDDLVGRIVSTVADHSGVLPRSMSAALRSRPVEELSPYEAVLRSFAYTERVTADELVAARAGLELAVRKAPAYADAWAMLAWLCLQDHAQGFDLQADSLANGLIAARRAVEAGPANHLAHCGLAQAFFFHKEPHAFRNAAERAVALNPMDGYSIAFLGELLTYAGDFERGLALAGRAKQLNPHHPGWYWYADFYNAYRQGDYRGALDYALKVNLPGQWFMHAALAAAYGQLGERGAAARAAQDLLRVRPTFAASVRKDIEKWWQGEYVERMIEGWRRAGLAIPDEPAGATSPPASHAPSPGSGETRADEGFWVAVLPFRYRGPSAAITALAEGLSEEIVTGFSRFSYLRVISRGSTRRYADAAVDGQQVGKEIGARYVLEGSIRQAGAQVRVAVQLVDATSGAHLWAETYDRPFEPDQAFAIQDDLVPRIVSTCADHFGVLARAISEAVRARPLAELTPYEALMRGFGYHFRLSPEEHAAAREALEKAVERAPANADCWAMLSWVYSHEDAHGFNPRPGSLDRALAAARRAVDLAPSNHLAYQALAVALFFRKEKAACRSAAERALALNPLDGSNEAIFLIAFTGDWERGCTLIRWAMEHNPHHPRWYRVVLGLNEYRQAHYREAVDEIVAGNVPDSFWRSAVLAAALGQLGELAAAGSALREVLAEKDGFARAGRQFFGKWFEPDLVESLMSGLRMAGLAEPTSAPAPAQSAGTEIAPVSIAVLPFSDMSPARDQEYLCEGMAEEIMNALVRVDGIRVASRTSAFRACRDGRDLKETARLLGVGHVLEGSVRTAGGRLRVTAQLTDVATGFQVWSERFDRDAGDVFAVQDEIAVGVVDAVRTRLAAGAHGVRPRPQVRNLEAYQVYLQARHLRFTKNDHGGALRCFERAIELDPAHAPSWVGLAEIKVLVAFYGLQPARAAYESARAALATAASLAGESATALHVEGMIATADRDWPSAERLLRRAVALEPANVAALCWLGVLMTLLGRHDEAALALQHARDLDPLSPYPHAMTGMCMLGAGRIQEAERHHAQAQAFDPDNMLSLWGLGVARTALGQTVEGTAALERALARGLRVLMQAMVGWARAVAGSHAEARAALAELRQRPEPAPAVVAEAWLLAALGDAEAAWEVLGRAEDERQLLLLFTGMPGFDPLRDDERFEQLVRRLGLPRAPRAAAPPPPPAVGGPAGVAIAVLPFVNRSDSADDEYFSDGLAEELISALSQLPGVRVAGRSSAFRFRGDGLDLRAIGRELGVTAVIEGSVRIIGDRLRLTARLVDCVSGHQKWSSRFDRQIADIFDTQDEIVRAFVEQLGVTIGGEAARPRLAHGAGSLEAYRHYLKGRHLRGKEDHIAALRAFEEAVRLDPSHAPSWTGLAEITVLASVFGLIPAREACANARQALATATRLQGESAEGLHVEAFAAWIERRWAAMETAWRRALELQPTHVLALGSFAISLCSRQRLAEAMPLFARAREADPLSSFPYTLTGLGVLNCGRPQEALRYLEDALSFEKEDATALDGAGMTNVALGRVEEGIAALERVVAVSHRGAHFLGTLGWALATAGRKDEARTLLEELRARPPAAPAVVSEAWLLGALGEFDAAFEVVARAEEECQAYLYFTGLPGFDTLRADPRFSTLLSRLELPAAGGGRP